MKRSFFADIYVRTACIGYLALGVVALLLAWSIEKGTNVLVIHFTGEGNLDFFGSRMHVLGIAGAGFIAALVNVFLAYVFYDRMRFFSYILVFFNILVGTLILIAIGVILTVN
jgi:hypothetical protein